MPEPITRYFTNRRRRTVKPVCLIVHGMSQYISKPDDTVPAWDWLEQSGLSVHALIQPDGTVVQTGHDDDVCYHAGKSRIVLGDKTWEGLNAVSLGAEFLVAGEHNYLSFVNTIKVPGTYSEAQLAAGAILYAGWCKQFSLPVERIVRHSDVSGSDVRGPGEGKVDPGEAFPLATFRDMVQALL